MKLLIMLVFLTSCSLIPKGHGSDANYQFSISKDSLQKKIEFVIISDSNLVRPKLYENDNYYNSNGYFTILYDGSDFCFRFLGDSVYWDSNENTSEIFIAFIKSKNNNRSKSEEIKLIENVFINKLGESKKH